MVESGATDKILQCIKRRARTWEGYACRPRDQEDGRVGELGGRLQVGRGREGVGER